MKDRSGTSAAPPGIDYMGIDVLKAAGSDMAMESLQQSRSVTNPPAVLDWIRKGCTDR